MGKGASMSAQRSSGREAMSRNRGNNSSNHNFSVDSSNRRTQGFGMGGSYSTSISSQQGGSGKYGNNFGLRGKYGNNLDFSVNSRRSQKKHGQAARASEKAVASNKAELAARGGVPSAELKAAEATKSADTAATQAASQAAADAKAQAASKAAARVETARVAEVKRVGKVKDAGLSTGEVTTTAQDVAAGNDTSLAGRYMDARDTAEFTGFNDQKTVEIGSEIIGAVSGTGSIGRKITSKVGQTALGLANTTFGSEKTTGIGGEIDAGYKQGQQKAIDTGLGFGEVGDAIARGLSAIIPGGSVFVTALRANELSKNPLSDNAAGKQRDSRLSNSGGQTYARATKPPVSADGRQPVKVVEEVAAPTPAVPIKLNPNFTAGIGIATKDNVNRFATFGKRTTTKARARTRGR